MASMQDTVSVIVTYHNEGELLHRSLQSIADQTYKGDIEVIVVDDASEVSPVLPDRFRLPIRLHRSALRMGASKARNLGIEMSSGQYICFLDADDAYLPSKLEAQVGFLASHPEVAVVGGQNYVHRDGKVWLYTPEVIDKCYPDLATQTCTLPRSIGRNLCIYYGFNTCATTFRRTLLDSIGGFDADVRHYEEWDLLVRTAENGLIGYIPSPVYLYLCRSSGSLTTTHNAEKFASIARMFRSRRRRYPSLPRGFKKELRERERGWNLLAAQLYLEKDGQPLKSLSHALQSLLCRPSIWGFRSTVRSGLHVLVPVLNRRLSSPECSVEVS